MRLEQCKICWKQCKDNDRSGSNKTEIAITATTVVILVTYEAIKKIVVTVVEREIIVKDTEMKR